MPRPASTPPELLSWRAEMESAALYRGLAALERHPRRRRVYERLAGIEAGHAHVWSDRLTAAGVVPAPFRPAWRTRALLWCARRFGTAAVLPRVARWEHDDAVAYAGAAAAETVAEEERANAALLAEFSQREVAEFFKKALLRLRAGVVLLVGGTLFTVSLLLARNAQLEGLFFGLLTGVVVGPVVHYVLGKLIVALPFGRVWCGWACWTAAVMDQLPFRSSAGWLPLPYRRLRYVHFGLSLTLVVTLVVGFGYGAGAVGTSAAAWFVVGNVVYWLVAVALAVGLRDNRAFCKYVCPVAVILKLTARPALLKIAGDAQACHTCTSRACSTLCPMDIDIPAYVGAGSRVLSSECIVCQQCVAVCPPNTLTLSFGLDLSGPDRLQERPRRAARSRPPVPR